MFTAARWRCGSMEGMASIIRIKTAKSKINDNNEGQLQKPEISNILLHFMILFVMISNKKIEEKS